MITYQEIYALNPCEDALEWLQAQEAAGLSPVEAWQTCENPVWMFWLLARLNMLSKTQDLSIQLAMLDTPLHDGRKVRDLITDERSLAFIDMKRRRLAGEEIPAEDWSAARVAALDAARVASRYAADAALAAASKWQADKIRELINPFEGGQNADNLE